MGYRFTGVESHKSMHVIVAMALALSAFDILQSVVGLSMWLLIGMGDDKELVDYENYTVWVSRGVETLLDDYRGRRKRGSDVSLTPIIDGSLGSYAPSNTSRYTSRNKRHQNIS